MNRDKKGEDEEMGECKIVANDEHMMHIMAPRWLGDALSGEGLVPYP